MLRKLTPHDSCSSYCWNDKHAFVGIAYATPVKKTRGGYQGYGYFCSLSCVKTYILTMYDGKHNVLTLFEAMVNDLYKGVSVHAAPDPHVLETFNSNFRPPLLIERYRAMNTPTYTTHTLVDDTPSARLLGTDDMSIHPRGNVENGIGGEKWCWNDGYPFVGEHVAVPVDMREEGLMKVTGHFCSLNCAKRFLVDRMYTLPGMLSFFSWMCIHVYQVSPGRVEAAQSHFLLVKYGGSVTIDSYRSAHFRTPPAISGFTVHSPLFLYSAQG